MSMVINNKAKKRHKKRDRRDGIPRVSDSIVLLIIIMLTLVFWGGFLEIKLKLIGVGITQLTFLIITLLAAWITKSNFKETFSFNLPRISQVLGAILIELGVFAAVTVIAAYLVSVFPGDSQSVNETFKWLIGDMSFAESLIIIALCPAICEEMIFRGFVFSAMKNRFRPVLAMLIVAALFGIYHMSIVKFFTTGLIGFFFCYVVYRSGSIFLSMLMHFLNNAVSVVMMFYSTDYASSEELIEEGVPVEVMVLFGVVAVILILIGNKLIKKKESRGLRFK